MSARLSILALAVIAATSLSAQEHIPDIGNTPVEATDSAIAPHPLPASYIDAGNYVPSCLLSDEEAAARIAFSTPSYSPVIAGWENGIVWAGGGSVSYPGMMGVESGTIGITQRIGRVYVSATAGAAKYGYFRGLSTQWTFGGSAQWQFAPRLGLTVFGSYSTRAFRPGMAPGVSEMLSQSSFGGYLSWDIAGRFGVDVGASVLQSPMSNRWEARPIVAPYYKAGNAKISIDVGGMLYEILRSRTGAGPHNPTIGPPKPIMPRVPGN
ncbi:MAG: hypothetical protein JFR38_05925 [Muribaculaceae bacterium]|nr:hypothetical protein [Muribaculaceae bacterium]